MEKNPVGVFSIGRTANGYMIEPGSWTETVMRQMAIDDDFELTEEIVNHILKARRYYDEYSKVPPIRTFAKYVGEDKKRLFKVYLGGPMKFITKYGGLPQPTGCV
jgi:tRNA 2-thiouridine synthesizing protein E